MPLFRALAGIEFSSLTKLIDRANQLEIKEAIRNAVKKATEDAKLRPNSVDSLTGKNSGDNLGEGVPVIKFEQWEKDYIEVKLILKGGGCENKNAQYSLPCELEGLGRAGRDLDGIRKCILHAVWKAQGQGCSAGFIGVGIGGDRSASYDLAKDQLFRHLEDTNPIPELAKLENVAKLLTWISRVRANQPLSESALLGQNRLPSTFIFTFAMK